VAFFSHYNDPLQFYSYVDASYILHPDSTSHTGYLITFEKSGSFFSKLMKQKLVAISSTHAETIALFSLKQEVFKTHTLGAEPGHFLDRSFFHLKVMQYREIWKGWR
jgi:hypothetical protein